MDTLDIATIAMIFMNDFHDFYLFYSPINFSLSRAWRKVFKY
jgi:hypothetical protein